jgi:hypothetical protein
MQKSTPQSSRLWHGGLIDGDQRFEEYAVSDLTCKEEGSRFVRNVPILLPDQSWCHKETMWTFNPHSCFNGRHEVSHPSKTTDPYPLPHKSSPRLLSFLFKLKFMQCPYVHIGFPSALSSSCPQQNFARIFRVSHTLHTLRWCRS